MSSPARRILAAHKPKKSSPLSQSQSQQQLPAFGGGPVEDGKNSPSASGQKPASAAGPSPSKKPSLLSSALEGAKNGLSGFDQKPASPASPSDSKKSDGPTRLRLLPPKPPAAAGPSDSNKPAGPPAAAPSNNNKPADTPAAGPSGSKGPLPPPPTGNNPPRNSGTPMSRPANWAPAAPPPPPPAAAPAASNDDMGDDSPLSSAPSNPSPPPDYQPKNTFTPSRWVPPPPPPQAPAPPMAPMAPMASSVPRYNNGLPLALWTLADEQPAIWEALVGYVFMWSGLSPKDVLWPANEMPLAMGVGMEAAAWVRDLGKLDKLEKDINAVPHWPKLNERDSQLLSEIPNDAILFAIRYWAGFDMRLQRPRLGFILEKACWFKGSYWGETDWNMMRDAKQMPEGPEREQQLAVLKAQSPRLFEHLHDDRTCGWSTFKRKRIPETEDPDSPTETQYTIYYDNSGRYEYYDQQYEDECRESRKKARTNMSSFGRPMQVHAVPLEERAFDSRGKRLPWGLEWPEGHANARGQRRQPEEKGPFGKSSVRKGSSRATRTATPAKREPPGLDGFHEAWVRDMAANRKQQSSPTRNQTDGTSTHRAPTLDKVPTEVMLYGYSASTLWAAIDFYERVSGGMVCEDYPREPDVSQRRYPNTFSSSGPVHSRPLTPAEKKHVCKYAGGEHWIKVTFDSAEAAERAIAESGHRIQGHTVYAQEYRGVGPDADVAIPYNAEDRATQRPAQTVGPASGQRSNVASRNAATLPRSFTSSATPQASQIDIASSSPSTASSATATGPSNGQLRSRHPSQAEVNRSSTTSLQNGQATPRPQGFTHFPDIPRTVLRPASEAFLPQPTRMERLYQNMVNAGLFPGDFIGNGAPRLDNGDFDWATASIYWRVCYWIDTKLGSDLCGLRD